MENTKPLYDSLDEVIDLPKLKTMSSLRSEELNISVNSNTPKERQADRIKLIEPKINFSFYKRIVNYLDC